MGLEDILNSEITNKMHENLKNVSLNRPWNQHVFTEKQQKQEGWAQPQLHNLNFHSSGHTQMTTSVDLGVNHKFWGADRFRNRKSAANEGWLCVCARNLHWENVRAQRERKRLWGNIRGGSGLWREVREGDGPGSWWGQLSGEPCLGAKSEWLGRAVGTRAGGSPCLSLRSNRGPSAGEGEKRVNHGGLLELLNSKYSVREAF